MSDAPYKFYTHLSKTEDYLLSYLACSVLCLLTSFASGNIFLFLDSSVETLAYIIRVIFSISQGRQLRYPRIRKYYPAGRKFSLEFKFAIWLVAISLNLKSAYNYFFEISQ